MIFVVVVVIFIVAVLVVVVIIVVVIAVVVIIVVVIVVVIVIIVVVVVASFEIIPIKTRNDGNQAMGRHLHRNCILPLLRMCAFTFMASSVSPV